MINIILECDSGTFALETFDIIKEYFTKLKEKIKVQSIKLKLEDALVIETVYSKIFEFDFNIF